MQGMVGTPEDARPVALVTGGADGIGWAIARRFAAGGHRVVIADLREDAGAARARELGDGHLAAGADVASESAVCAMVARAVERFGRLDVLINNAGVADSFLPTTEQSGEAFGRLLDIHLKGTFLASREAARAMLRQRRGGAIVNLSSIAGLTGLPRRNAYGAAKAGIVAMTRSMACEWRGKGSASTRWRRAMSVRRWWTSSSARGSWTPRPWSGAPRWDAWRGRRRSPRRSGSWRRPRRVTSQALS